MEEQYMQLTGELKDKVEKAESKEEAKQTIKEAGMILDDAELDQVSGGAGSDGHKRHSAFHVDYNREDIYDSLSGNLNAGSGLA
ncbi:MAG: hypothetical protein IJJ13_08535 [Lachnospiraceae bacterium]|nr:hypothetical protein [Lachnospiraceae bacterium]